MDTGRTGLSSGNGSVPLFQTRKAGQEAGSALHGASLPSTGQGHRTPPTQEENPSFPLIFGGELGDPG